MKGKYEFTRRVLAKLERSRAKRETHENADFSLKLLFGSPDLKK